MSSAVSGSRPEFGSSQKRYLGLLDIARAIATRFIIPPLNSDGIILFIPLRLTLFRQKFTRSNFSSYDKSVNIFKGNITFCSTFIESKSQIIGGLKWVEEPQVLRFFFGRLKEIGHWQEELVSKFKEDFGDSL